MKTSPDSLPKSLTTSLVVLVISLFPACSSGGGGGSTSGGTEGGGGGGGGGSELDSDMDGLTDQEETLGWEIVVDTLGFGADASPDLLTRRQVTSDPLRKDTDGDGIDDGREFQLRSDPRRADTDGDGLDDLVELERWATSLISVDTDGDARGASGNLPPNSRLFDGAELTVLGT